MGFFPTITQKPRAKCASGTVKFMGCRNLQTVFQREGSGGEENGGCCWVDFSRWFFMAVDGKLFISLLPQTFNVNYERTSFLYLKYSKDKVGSPSRCVPRDGSLHWEGVGGALFLSKKCDKLTFVKLPEDIINISSELKYSQEKRGYLVIQPFFI